MRVSLNRGVVAVIGGALFRGWFTGRMPVPLSLDWFMGRMPLLLSLVWFTGRMPLPLSVIAGIWSMVSAMPDPNRIRETAHEVLQGSDYKLNTPTDFRKVWEWLSGLLKPIFKMLENLHDASPVLYFIVLFLLMAAIVGMTVHIVYSFRNAFRRSRPKGDYSVYEDTSDEMPQTWEKRARDAYAAGDYLAAVRHILTAGLLTLELANKGRLRRGSTNREYLRRYANTAAYDPLSQLVEITDTRWFGGIECTARDVEQCFQAQSRLREITSGRNADVHRA